MEHLHELEWAGNLVARATCHVKPSLQVNPRYEMQSEAATASFAVEELL